MLMSYINTTAHATRDTYLYFFYCTFMLLLYYILFPYLMGMYFGSEYQELFSVSLYKWRFGLRIWLIDSVDSNSPPSPTQIWLDYWVFFCFFMYVYYVYLDIIFIFLHLTLYICVCTLYTIEESSFWFYDSVEWFKWDCCIYKDSDCESNMIHISNIWSDFDSYSNPRCNFPA